MPKLWHLLTTLSRELTVRAETEADRRTHMPKLWHLLTTLSRELTVRAETEAEAIAGVQDRLQPGEAVNVAWIDPGELSEC